jgi:hypothetical protein
VPLDTFPERARNIPNLDVQGASPSSDSWLVAYGSLLKLITSAELFKASKLRLAKLCRMIRRRIAGSLG